MLFRRVTTAVVAAWFAVFTVAASQALDQRFTDADLSFHLLVLDASGNLMMRSIGALIGAALAAAFRLSAPSDSLETLHRSHRHHCAITDAIRARDPKAAADAMTTVIEDGWASLGETSEPTIAMIRTHLFP